MKRFGNRLDILYEKLDLRHKIGSYEPQLSASASTQFVPSVCSVSQFEKEAHSVVKQYNLECTYIHFVRLLALAYDAVFQKAVRDALAKANIELDGENGVSTRVKGMNGCLTK